MQKAALRAELHEGLLRDLDSLEGTALRYRLQQVAGELQERNKWEALRQHELWRRAEAEIARKYTNLLQLQRQQLEGLLERKVRSHREECAQKTRHVVQSRELELAQELHELLAAKEKELATFLDHRQNEEKYKMAANIISPQYSMPLSKSKDDATAACMDRVAQVRDLTVTVQALDAAFASLRSMAGGDSHSHKLAAVALAHGPATKEVAKVKRAAGVHIQRPRLSVAFCPVTTLAHTKTCRKRGKDSE